MGPENATKISPVSNPSLRLNSPGEDDYDSSSAAPSMLPGTMVYGVAFTPMFSIEFAQKSPREADMLSADWGGGVGFEGVLHNGEGYKLGVRVEVDGYEMGGVDTKSGTVRLIDYIGIIGKAGPSVRFGMGRLWMDLSPTVSAMSLSSSETVVGGGIATEESESSSMYMGVGCDGRVGLSVSKNIHGFLSGSLNSYFGFSTATFLGAGAALSL